MTYTQWELVLDECAFLKYGDELYFNSGWDKDTKVFEFTNISGTSKIRTTFEEALRNDSFSIAY